MVLADVAGHGELVSAAAGKLRDALRQHVDHWDQSALIRELNESFLKTTSRAEYATAFLASFYSETGELLFTNAGHLPPLWYRAATGEWSLMADSTPLSKEVVDLPLGLIAGTGYRQTAVQIEQGDLLLLYTDGDQRIGRPIGRATGAGRAAGDGAHSADGIGGGGGPGAGGGGGGVSRRCGSGGR